LQNIRAIARCSISPRPKPAGAQPLAKGRGRGIAVHESFKTFVAQVAEVTVLKDGGFRVDRVVCAVDCGVAINPDVIRAQMEGGVGFGLSAALHGAITLKDGRVEQSNFHDYRPLRINEMPRSRCTSCRRPRARPAWANLACRRLRPQWRTRLRQLRDSGCAICRCGLRERLMTDLADWDRLRKALRELHRALAERASRDYAYAHELLTQPTPGELLQMLTKDPEFNWLRGLSELMVAIDIARDDEPQARAEFERGVRAAVERFIAPPKNLKSPDEFTQRYWPYVQEDPHVAMAHAAVKLAISKWPPPQTA
jgi:hypothetical protein